MSVTTEPVSVLAAVVAVLGVKRKKKLTIFINIITITHENLSEKLNMRIY